MRWAGHVARIGEGKGIYRVSVGKLEGERSLGRSKLRWEDNINMVFRKQNLGIRTGLSWLRIGTGGGHL
jgi:hypothetical protein